MKYLLLILLLLVTINLQARGVNWRAFEKNHAKYDSTINVAAEKYNLEPELIKAIITWESEWKVNPKPWRKYIGLMQVSGGSKNPHKNIMQGCKKLRRYIDIMAYCCTEHNIYTDSSLKIMYGLSAYNMGCNGFIKYNKKWHGVTGYAHRVYGIYIEIKNLIGGKKWINSKKKQVKN